MEIPGKVFILGEYAVLAQLPAIVAAVPPRFSMDEVAVGEETEFHPLSPFGRLQEWIASQFQKKYFKWNDPLEGQGGFGASTAQFALAYRSYFESGHGMDAWRLYRKLVTGVSGADLIGQWFGGVQLVNVAEQSHLELWDVFPWSSLLVFSATHQPGRKVSTHDHLVHLKDFGFQGFQEPLLDGIQAIHRGDLVALGKAMDRYAEVLHRLELEIKATFEDRKALRSLPGVLGVKGTGALQADAVLVLVDQNADQSQIIATAESRGLRLVCQGLKYQAGVL